MFPAAFIHILLIVIPYSSSLSPYLTIPCIVIIIIHPTLHSIHLEKGSVQVNYKVIKNSSYLLHVDDVIIIKDLGTCIIEEIGTTKKERMRVICNTTK